MQNRQVVPFVPIFRESSMQMKAVLMILRADLDLLCLVDPFLDLYTETIFWDKIWKLPLLSHQKAALVFAYSLWTDEIKPRCNPFEMAFLMNFQMRKACLNAMALRWGLTMK